ncbi:HAMP domain-containing histidine kinase [Sphingomonas sp. AP4-R1]|uniref:ATP-binding protein n=1 Tax=Sphingomonas sp. AP4-R1 TaxID=2735134 RepID=UPI0015972DEF|nr:ATP-binding protein [Sphingomonas sp. AP4-R1]QJU57708.1 HAMP domain-containing histidine kinase [Sphingomonas sp. AP4-R1]
MTPPAADAGRRNMLLLIQLRWIAVGGQLLTIAVVQWLLDIPLPLVPLLMTPLLMVLINAASLPLISRRLVVTNAELTAALLLDVGALGWQLFHSGGLANPFASLFLLQIVLGAILLKPVSSAAIMLAICGALGILAFRATPLALPSPYQANPLALYLLGNLACFTLIAILLVAFITRISRNLSQRDAALASARQRAAEEDHIIRMGLLASGAAHELGTPLSMLSVILGDWKRMDLSDPSIDLMADVAEMESAVGRCKTIVGGILMSAGEARGEAPKVTTVRAFLDGIVNGWRVSRLSGIVDYDDRFGDDVAIVSDEALRQVIGNVIDNAADFSPDWIGITARREGDALQLEIADHGPGFAAEILEHFGQPYRSTRGRAGGGLGLFLLVNVLRTLGGDASAANRPEGGAVVRLTLPLSALRYDAAAVAA